jgi:epoxyqueuosine reductase
MSDKPLPEKYDDFAALLPKHLSGNTVNGLGEETPRRPSPFFWHPADRHEFGELQYEVIAIQRRSPEIIEHYSHDAPRGPKEVEKAPAKVEKSPEDWTAAMKEFALAHEADLVGVTPMDPMYIYEGYELDHPWLIVFGVAMDHDELNNLPPSLDNPRNAVEVARQYNRAARVCREVANFILGQGYDAKAWAGPFASALSMMPGAIAAGLGTLGKHGSLINDVYGSSFRLSAVTTDIPLIADAPKDIGAEDFCANCQVCVKACPPGAIFPEKQTVRGEKKWFVNFDKCIPYFGEALGCAICITKCPWSTPGRAPKLMDKMLGRRNRLK